MPTAVPTNEGWVLDTIDHYRLTPAIISGFLKQKWGNYDFAVVVGSQPWDFISSTS